MQVAPRPHHASRYNTVNLRIETNTSTLWEGPITSGPRNITLGQGEYYGSVPCNGQNGIAPGANPGAPPGNTPLDALDAASKIRGFSYDGYYDDTWNDFFINTIDGLANWGNGTVYTFWGAVINYQVSAFGHGLTLSGCQQLLNLGDSVLWAYMPVGPSFDDFRDPEISFLKATPAAVTVKKGKGFTVTVIDGRTGNATLGATVAGVKTDADGKATIVPSKAGVFVYKAEKVMAVRSNAIHVTVTN